MYSYYFIYETIMRLLLKFVSYKIDLLYFLFTSYEIFIILIFQQIKNKIVLLKFLEKQNFRKNNPKYKIVFLYWDL